MAKLETTLKKFHSRYERLENGCWSWLAYVAPDGYGKMMAFGEQYAHRVSYIIHKGEIPNGMDIMHSCDNPTCVNPDHLEIGFHADNMADMAQKGRSVRGEKHRDSKLTEQAVIDMRLGCISVLDACENFNVALITAQQAKSGITWKYLNDTVEPY